jgi:putative chitinase
MTPADLARALGCSPATLAPFLPHLTDALEHYGINTPLRLAHFCAQIGHESGSLRWVREIWGPTPAQQRYEGRQDLGNTEPGDGRRYMGRGLIQTTGRANYRSVTRRLRDRGAPDFEQHPEQLETPKWAAWSACDYWAMRTINAHADADDLLRVTRLVNGGTNGLEDRRRRLAAAKAVLLPDTTPAPIVAPMTLQEAPVAPFIAAALPALIQAIPTLGKLFGSGSDVAERNVKAAELAVQIVQQATGTNNAQAAAEAVAADPELAKVAAEAVQARWLELTEAGGGGIAGARAADAAFRGSGDSVWRSPSFIVALALLPLVYLVLTSVLFGIGPDWPSDVRAAIATAIVSMVIGSVAGYYFGQTTSRNRT